MYVCVYVYVCMSVSRQPSDGLAPVGNFCLNLMGCAPSANTTQTQTQSQPVIRNTANYVSIQSNNTLIRPVVHLLTRTYQQVLPLTAIIPITVDQLNTQRFAPVKDVKANRLLSGAMQLGKGTLVVMDESNVKPGRLHTHIHICCARQ